jgi:23S rRNA pseudouridine1911/1915/1917 synthase
MEKEYDIIITPEHLKERLDIFLSRATGISRSQITRLFEHGFVKLNNKPAKPGYHIRNDDRVFVRVPEPENIEAKPEDIPLDIIYEDQDIIVINKPRGCVVHPAISHPKGTLVNALLHHCKDLSGIGGSVRPGVVHRLDKDTSGLMVFAKNDNAHQNLSKQIKDRTVKKIYYALVYGIVKKDSGEINEPLGRHPTQRNKIAVIKSDKLKKRESLTYYRVLKRFKDYSLLELDLRTGRTHQIRVHLAYIGHPVVGDLAYTKRKNEFGISGQLLHAGKLSFDHPVTGKRMTFEAPMPEEMKRILELVEDKARDNTEEK